MKPKTGYYMYNNLPGVWKNWTLAVCAVSRTDANNYVKVWYHGGKFVYSVLNGGNVKADCGAVTTEAAKVLAENMQAVYENQ